MLDGVQLKIDGTATLLVTNDIKIASTAKLSITTDAQLVHRNPNSVNVYVEVERKTRKINKFDYTYFCSPVQGQVLNQIANPLVHVPPFYMPPLSDKYLRHFGNWIYIPENDIMGSSPGNPEVGPGTGYIIRGPQSFTTPDYWFTKFSGNANNGDINVTLATGTAYTPCTADIHSPNLIGNPYPAAIDADTFLTNPTNAANLGGALYFWTHNTEVNPSAGVFDYTINDYVVYNILGGIGTGKVTGDLIYAPSGYNRPTGKIGSCQAFFVNGSGTAAFTNDMQDTSILTTNQQFYRHAQSNTTNMIPPISKSRIWLSLSSSSGTYKEILVGYVPATPNVPVATNGYEKAYDTNTYSATATQFYSNINSSSLCPKLVIQGRALGTSFNTDDVIPLGFSGPAGNYTIKAETFDGLFGSQMFWLKQTVGTTVTFHDIRTTGYPFTTTTVTTDDTTRFQIVFKSDAYTTQLVNNNCNITLADLNDLLFCIQVPGASGYIFEVTEVANPANVRTITRTVSSFSFQILPGITPLSTQYSVRVSPIVGGLSQGFGPACLITTQALPPTTVIGASACTTSNKIWDTFYITQVGAIGGVTPSRYRVTVYNHNTLVTSVLYLTLPASSFQLQNPGFSQGTTIAPNYIYSISVAYEWNGNWQAEGPICTHTKASSISNRHAFDANQGAETFEVKAYPNPFANNFKLDINTSGDEKVELAVYDMLGRQIEARVMTVSDSYNQEIGNDYASGVYNLVIKQNENVKTIRVMKR